MISNSVSRQPNTHPTNNSEVEKIRNLKNAIHEGEESGICDDFDAVRFLQTLKSTTFRNKGCIYNLSKISATFILLMIYAIAKSIFF